MATASCGKARSPRPARGGRWSSPRHWQFRQPRTRHGSDPSRAPLSCRTSPPQGRRLVVAPALANRQR
ncbi:hypothetical protein EJ074_07825 [Mesorhizobium sp. M3A.F.Ca.ET.080.04.2.1]|nr:hypothetical protein EJ074_07825 [Mesorhizobium sp. M3A.F.Ca.ET.080.04.2.1]RWF24704.1 MAG: hypothetical protein EOS64_06845 [Mesorhizobium sp.]